MSAVKQVIAINENEGTRREATQAGSVPVPGEIGGASSELVRALRRRLPDERRAITHHFSIAGQEGYLTVGVYDDGSPGEIFVRMAKEGSTISGLMDSIATLVSLALQHGVPLEVLCAKFSHTRFEPSGWSGSPKIGYATSLMDYLFRWMELKFLKKEQGELFESRPVSIHGTPPPNEKGVVEALGEFVQFGDAPACNICGSLMVRGGTCYRCMTCGSTSGCS
jgi:ribonucleoside-diphosphate reductase alpha chain